MRRILFCVLAALAAVSTGNGQVIRTNAGFYQSFIPRNDDGSSSATSLGFSINFFGKTRDTAFVNNNGNITFDSPLPTFTPFGLAKTSREIIAPFFADVDTRGAGSTAVTYGQDTVNGRKAFAANYIDVGYYSQHDDKRNRFQVVVIDRSDTGPGNFNIEFNYERIVWETGDASDGVNGYGGIPAAVGWSNGTTDDGASFQLPGSMVTGSFLDSGSRALIRAHLNTSQVGRLLFQARDGVISEGLKITNGGTLPAAITGSAYDFAFQASGVSGPITWELIPDISMPDSLTFANGHLSGNPTTPGTYTFTVSATADIDGEKITVSQRGSITVGPPKLTITTACPLPDGVVGQPYSVPFLASGTSTSPLWRPADRLTLPPGVTLSTAGLLGGVPSVPGTYFFTVKAQGAEGSGIESAERNCRMTVNPASVRVAGGCSLPDATVGVPYAQTLTMEGGVGPYTFELAGQLPLGLALTEDGRVLGIPTVPAPNPFQVRVTDARRSVSMLSCAVTVNDPDVAITASCPLPAATTGLEYSAALSASGGSGPYTWGVSGSLPTGLSVAPDGTISGTPMSAGPFQFRLLAADSAGRQAGKPCSLAVQSGPLSISSCPLPAASVGALYSTALTPAGGSAPYVWSLVGSLPAGLHLSTAGIVDGTPTDPGDYQFNLTLRDRNMQTITHPCSVQVMPLVLSFATSCPAPAATLGQAYTTRFIAKGGVPPYQFDFAGFLPDGLAGASDGTLSGRAQSAGPASFAVQITDARGKTTAAACSIDVRLPKPPAVSFSAMPQTVTAANGGLKIGVEVDKPYTLPISGQLTLAVSPNTQSLAGPGNQADPHVRFGNGQMTAGFTIPAGAARAEVPLLSTGTVASTIAVSLTSLSAAGSALPITVGPVVFQVPASVPAITSACFTKSDTSIQLAIIGSTTTRELKSVEVTAGSTSRTTDLNGVSSDYFSDARTVRSGGAFSLRFALDAAFLNSAGPFTVKLSNTAGTSAAVSAQRCQ